MWIRDRRGTTSRAATEKTMFAWEDFVPRPLCPSEPLSPSKLVMLVLRKQIVNKYVNFQIATSFAILVTDYYSQKWCEFSYSLHFRFAIPGSQKEHVVGLWDPLFGSSSWWCADRGRIHYRIHLLGYCLRVGLCIARMFNLRIPPAQVLRRFLIFRSVFLSVIFIVPNTLVVYLLQQC
jgi:hypothetical protein